MYNVSDLTELQNCSLFVNGGIILSTNSTRKFISQNFTASYSDGSYSWSINCTDSANNTGNSSLYTFTVQIPFLAEAGAGGGGGSGGAALPKEELIDYRVSADSIETELRLGKAGTQELTIKNTGATKIDFVLYPKYLSDYVFLSETTFSLDIGEEKTVILNMIGKDLGAHAGELIVSASGIRKIIPMIIAVESDQTLFDAKIDIPTEYKELSRGEELKAQITLFNIVGGAVDVTVNYIIKDMEGNVISDESEIFNVQEQKSYLKTYKTPELMPGNYVAIIEVRYAGSFAVSSELFSVKEEGAVGLAMAPPKATRQMLIYILLAIIALFLIYISVLLVLKRRN